MADSKKTTKTATKKTTKKSKKKKTPFKVFKGIILTILFICLLAGGALGGVLLAIVKTTPELDINEFLSLSEPSKLYDNKGVIMDEYKTPDRRVPVSITEAPEALKNAFISIEDERFENHIGIDFKRIAGALYADVKAKITGSGSLQGASTITQQLVKYKMFLSDSLVNRASIKRKVQEIYLATQIEKILSKDQILEAYMNTIYLGGKASGIEAASQQYFRKSVKQLSLVQCAFIASAAQNPSISYSVARESFKKNEPFESPRTKLILKKLYEHNKITKEQYDNTVTQKLTFSFSTKNQDKMNFEWFSRPVINTISKDLASKYHYSEDEIYTKLMYDGLKIYTTMDRNLQNSAQKIINDNNSDGRNSYFFPRDNNGNLIQPNIQASCVIVDYHTGEVKTIIGGRGEQAAMSFNRAASDKFLRAPGSTIKPLTVYAPAIDSKEYTAATIIEDSPLPIEIGQKYVPKGSEPYNPKNSPNIYRGYLTMREALMHSVNVVAVKLEDKLGLDVGAKYGEKFGLQLDDVDKQSIAALSLGQLDSGRFNGTNPLTMATAYGVFGNNGIKTTPRLYTKVVDKTGKVILETKYEVKKVISPQSAYIMYDLLKGPVSSYGTASRAKFSDMPIRGKTGTSSDARNLWFCGLTPYYSAAVWVGNDDYSKIEGLNSNAASGLWGKIMKESHTNLKPTEIPMPSGIVSIAVSKDSGNIPTDLTYEDPRGNRVYDELFLEGTEPSSLDNVHVKARVTKDANGKYIIAPDGTPEDKVETKVFIKREGDSKGSLEDSKYELPKEQPKPPDNNTNTEETSPPTEGENTTPIEDSNNTNNENLNNNEVIQENTTTPTNP